MQTDVEAVLFDIDGTICEYERGIDEMLSVAFDRADVEPFFEPAAYKSRFGEFTDESETMQELRERCFADIARSRGRDPATGEAVARAYAAERDHSRVEFVDGAAPLLDHCRDKYRLGAVTNGAPAMQSAKLDALDVDCFETVVHAGYETPAKPDPEPFEVALDALDATAENTLYVGDSLEADVGGGRNAGLATAWLGDGNAVESDPAPTVVLDSPRDLLDRI